MMDTIYRTRFCGACVSMLLMLTLPTYSQNLKHVEVVGSPFTEKDVIIVGDIHSNNEKGAFNSAMFSFVGEQFGIYNIVKECGASAAYLLNCYLRDGDTTVFHYYDKETREGIIQLRQSELALPPEKRRTYYGMDFERMDFILAVRLIFSKNLSAAGTELYKFTKKIPDSILNRNELTTASSKARMSTYKEARAIFRSEKEQLRQVVTTDFDVLECILENPTTERHFAKRDKGMCQNLMQQMKGKKYLCIVGQQHTRYSYHNVQTPLAKRLIRKGVKFTLVKEVCKASYDYTQWFHSVNDTGKHLNGPSGPNDIIGNESVMQLAFTKYYKSGCYSLINEAEFKEQGVKLNHGIPTYYAFFDYPQKEDRKR